MRGWTPEHVRSLEERGMVRGGAAPVVGARCHYRTDFLVEPREGPPEIHEIKGHMRDDARVKLFAAARLFPCFKFVLVRRSGRAWSSEIIGGQHRE